nr:reverse transcriptase domain-containing protein [Tanacetum cinerariifolium]
MTTPRVPANLNQWYPALLQSFDLPFHDINGLFYKLEPIVNVNSFQRLLGQLVELLQLWPSTLRNNGANPKGNGCFECGATGHFKRDCPELKNMEGEKVNSPRWVYAVGNAKKRWNASRDQNLNVLTGHPFNIDLIPVELGSFDVIIGMDWLRRCHAVIVCDEKLVRIPYGSETLTFHANESNNRRESRLTFISCSRAQEYMAKECTDGIDSPSDGRHETRDGRHAGRAASTAQIMAPVTRQGPSNLSNNTNLNNMTPKFVQAMIDQALLQNSTNGDGSHSSHEDNRRNVQIARPCFYADFMSVKFATCNLLDAALTWWNSQIRSLGPDAYSITWEVLKKKMTDKYCPQGEIKKLEIELWNLKVKENNVSAYTERFQELTLICTKFVADETEKID